MKAYAHNFARWAAIVTALVLMSATLAFSQDPTGRPPEESSGSGGKKGGRKGPVKVEQTPLTVFLTILTDPPESAVYINGEQRGVTNAEGKLQFEKLSFGRYLVEVRKDGFVNKARSFQAGAEPPTLVFKLDPKLDDVLQEFNSLITAGKLIGPESPNSLEVLNNLASKYPNSQQVAQMRAALVMRLIESGASVVTRSVNNWRSASLDEEIARADNAATVALSLNKEDKRAQARASYFRGLLALRKWQTGQPDEAKGDGEAGGGLSEARGEFEKAIALEDAWAAAHYQLGITLLNAGQLPAAEAAFVKVTQLEPRWARGYSALGEAYHMSGKHKEAIDAFSRAIQIDPNSAAAHAGLGLARAASGEAKEGIKNITRAIQLEPDSALPHLNLAIVYSMANKSKENALALEEFKKAIQLNPKNLEFQNSRAEQLMAGLQKPKK